MNMCLSFVNSKLLFIFILLRSVAPLLSYWGENDLINPKLLPWNSADNVLIAAVIKFIAGPVQDHSLLCLSILQI